MSMIQDFQIFGSHDTQDVTNLSLLGPHAAHPWPQIDGANFSIHDTGFSTNSSLSVGFFLPIFYSRLNFSLRILLMYLSGSNTTRDLRPNKCTTQRRHFVYRVYAISKGIL